MIVHCVFQTSYLPETDTYSQSKIQMIALIDIAMGGRVAEELKYGEDHVTSGMYVKCCAGISLSVCASVHVSISESSTVVSADTLYRHYNCIALTHRYGSLYLSVYKIVSVKVLVGVLTPSQTSPGFYVSAVQVL